MAVAIVGRYIVALFFLVGAVTKIQSVRRFRDSVREHGLFGVRLSMLVSIAVPILELVIATWLFSGVRSELAILATIATIAAFTLYIAVLRMQGKDLPCACLGMGGKLSDPLLTRNLALASMAAAGLNESFALYLSAAGWTLLVANILIMRRNFGARSLVAAD